MPPAAVERATSGQTSRILIVDDETQLCGVIARLLKRTLPPAHDALIQIAHTPDDALALLGEARPEDNVVVISDYNLGTPRNGIELLVVAAERHPGVRRVLMSGYPRNQFAEALDAANLDAFIPKPFDAREFASLVARLLDGAPAPPA